MPSSSFLFDSLLKSQKLDANNRVKKRDDAKTLGARNTKMFLTENLSKLNSVKSTTVYSGYLKTKTQNTEKKNNYLVLRQYGEKRVKLLLESYKDESLKKLKFIIDLDNVDQIDLNENSNTIYLSRSNNEKCSLEATSKNLTTIWLNAICQYCGFNEINNFQGQLNIQLEDQNARRSKTSQVSHERFVNLETNQNLTGASSTNKKIIAGIAAASVGSFDLCNAHLDNIFKNSTPSFSENKLSSLLMTHQDTVNAAKESYIDLQECLSGVDFESATNNTSTIDSRKLANKLIESDQSQSFSSSEKLNHRKLSFDEDNSVFDLDVGQNGYSILDKTKTSLQIKNRLHDHHYYQDKYNVSREYYNYPEAAGTRNDYTNYTPNYDCNNVNMPGDQVLEPAGLGYVQLVVANRPNQFSTFKFDNKNKTDLNDSLESTQIKSFKDSKENDHENNSNNNIYNSTTSNQNITKDKVSHQFNGQYTSINAIRTNALKHTQVEFQRPGS